MWMKKTRFRIKVTVIIDQILIRRKMIFSHTTSMTLIKGIKMRRMCRTLGCRDTTSVITLTLVAYQGKTVSLPPARSPHGTSVDIF